MFIYKFPIYNKPPTMNQLHNLNMRHQDLLMKW